MAEGGSVEIEIVKVVTLGPPEAGKTQLKRALTGNMQESTESTPLSTGAEVIMERFFDGEIQWEELCASELQKALYNTIQGKNYNPKFPQSSVDTSVSQATQSSNPEIQTPHPHKSTDVCDLKSSTAGKDIFLPEFTKLKERVLDNFSKSQRGKHLNKVRFIHFIDSGGQPAFFDVHPVIATSRAVYLIVYNSAEGLSAHPKFTYRKPKDFPTRVLSNTNQTNLDMINRSLFTLHHCKDKFLKMEERLERCLGAENVSLSSNKRLPILMVGTRKSQSHDSHSNLMHKLMSCFSSNPSLRSGIWVDARFVESSDPSCQGVEDLRQIISNSICKFKIHFPLKWFYCQLIFWSADDPAFTVMQFCDLKDLCIREGFVSNDDMFLALLITFHMLGIFCCPDLDDADFDEEHLQHSPVFTKPDVLYQQVSTLLEIPFRDLRAPQAKSMHELIDLQALQKSGIITEDSLTLLGIPDAIGSFIGFHAYLLKYLVGWGLAADVSALSSLDQDGVKSKQLFIPSVLPPRDLPPREEKDDFRSANCPIPLFALSICDKKSEEYYIPQGLFPHFVVSLMHQSQKGYVVKVGDEDSYPRCRDVITITKQAQTGTQFPYTVYVVDNLDHVAVRTNPAQTNEDVPLWLPNDCRLILEDLQNTMAEAYTRLYQKRQQPSVILGYECPCPLAKKRGTHLARLDCDRDVPVIHCLSSGQEGIWETTCTDTLREILCSGRKGQFVRTLFFLIYTLKPNTMYLPSYRWIFTELQHTTIRI